MAMVGVATYRGGLLYAKTYLFRITLESITRVIVQRARLGLTRRISRAQH